jgi:hypothetical protein
LWYPVYDKGKNAKVMSKQIENNATAIIEYLKPMLYPLIRFCLKRGVKLQEFLEISKELFIEAGKNELSESDVEQSTNRISIYTGVHRRDVERFKTGTPKKKTTADILTRVLGQWKNDKRFCLKLGKPKPLTFSGKEGEFADLVYSVSKELSPYTVLSELERLNFIEHKDEKLVLKANEYTPKKDLELSLNLVGQDIADLVSAVERNTFHEVDIPSLHLSTRYDNVCEEYLPLIKEWLMKEGERIHVRARNFLSKYDKDLNTKLENKKGGCRIVLGTFGHAEINKKDLRK